MILMLLIKLWLGLDRMLFSDSNEVVINNSDNYYSLCRIYAHGDLQILLNFDSLVTDNIFELNDMLKNFIDNKKILYLKLTDNNGIIHDVVVYLWTGLDYGHSTMIMGLVMLLNDTVYI